MYEEIKAGVNNKGIENSPSMEEKIITINVNNSYREIITSNIEWLLGGYTISWEYYKSPYSEAVILRRW